MDKNDHVRVELGSLQLLQSESSCQAEIDRQGESALQQRRYAARFVRAGRVRAAGNRLSNIEVPAAVLEDAVQRGLFEARAVFVDHAGAGESQSLRNLVGVTGKTEFSEDAVNGEITLYANARQVAALLDEVLAGEGNAPDVGLSMVFWPEWEDPSEDRLRRLKRIFHVESVDLVFEPAADGRVLHALSRELADCDEVEGKQHRWNGTSEGGVPEGSLCLDCGRSLPQQDRITRQKEDLMQEQVNSPIEPAEMWLPALAKASAQAMIQASGLPRASRDRLNAGDYATPGDVDAAIIAERNYLAQLQADQVVQIGGRAPRGGHIQVGMDGLERLGLALEALLQGRNPENDVQPLSGIREAYILLSGDYEMTGMFNPERLQFANVNSSTLAGMVANALNKSVVREFQQYPRWWEPVVFTEDFANLQQVKWITLGGVGDLPTVAEGAAYTELTWDDQTETASFVKKGGYLGLTLEAIDKDDTRRLASAPRALAQSAWLTLSKSISAIFTDNTGAGPTMSDSTALFDASHGNLGSTGLSVTSWAATRLAMRKQTELNSGERLGALVAPKFLLVPPDLEVTALQVLGAEKDYTYALANATAAPDNVFAEGSAAAARLVSARNRVIVVDLWTDTNNWAAVADPLLYPTIGLGFRYGRVPEIYSVASPTAGLMFSNDTMPIKVRFFYAVGPTDWRGLYKHNVS